MPRPYRFVPVWLAVALLAVGCGGPRPAAIPASATAAASLGVTASIPAGSPSSPGAPPSTPAPTPSPPTAPPTSAPDPASPSPTARPAPTPRPVPAGPPTMAGPRVVNSLQTALDEAHTSLSIPGISATIVFPDGAIWTGVSGFADVAARRPVRPETPFAIASISKTFVAALVLQLVDEGRFGLDDPVAPLLPGVDLDPAITVRMLLDHTSGLHDFFNHPRIDRALQGGPARRWTAERALGYVQAPYFEPGTGWKYSNTNYLLLGLLVERVTGRTVGAELRDRFFDPLHLATAYDQLAEAASPAVAHGYRLTGPDGSARLTDLADGTGLAPFRSAVSAAGGAGSVAAGSRDVALWAKALYGGAAIDPASLASMVAEVEPFAIVGPRVPYGLGVQIRTIDGRLTYGHSGGFIGIRVVMRWLPEEQVAIAVLTNQSRHDAGQLAARLLRIALPEQGPCRCWMAS